MNFTEEILPCLDNNELCILKLKQLGLLARDIKCIQCNRDLLWTKHKKAKDGFAWKCQNTKCKIHKNTVSVRNGSFFANSNLSLAKWVHLIYLWSIQTSNQQAHAQTGVSKQSITNAYACLREICDRYLLKNPIRLGGPGVIVQIDESCFSHKPKHHRGRAPEHPIWVFGIVDTSYQPAVGYMEIVEKRDAETLLPIIQAVVDRKSIIHSDEWKAYSSLQRSGYQHSTVNHSLNFVEPVTGVHTQNIESYWNVKKAYIKKMWGCHRNMLHWYLQEFMWRDRFARNNNCFNNICLHITHFYPFNN